MSAPVTIQTTPGSKMIATMVLVASICGVLIVGAFESTQGVIVENKRIMVERAVFKVLPGAAKVSEYVATPSGVRLFSGNISEGGVKFYAAYDAAGGAQRYRCRSGGQGICRCGASALWLRHEMSVHHRHRRGVHARDAGHRRIITDQVFLKNFEALDVRVNAEMSALAHAVKVVKHGTKQNAWEIDAIAGATVTSKAVGRGINESAQRLMPMLVPHIGELQP